MPNATPSRSPPTVGSARALPSLHNSGDIVGEGGHVGSVLAVSANPTTSPRLLMALACPLLPPTVGRALMWPFCQRNGRHVSPVPKPQTSSPSGSGTDVSAIPTTSPRSLIWPQFIQLFFPPSVPRSILSPSTSIAARPCTSVPKTESLKGSKVPYITSVQP